MLVTWKSCFCCNFIDSIFFASNEMMDWTIALISLAVAAVTILVIVSTIAHYKYNVILNIGY